MPELPEVETIKTALEKSLGKCRIESININNYRLREEVPCDISDVITGAQILKYQRRAKYIIISLNNKYSLIWHMGMSGKISITESKNRYDKHDHIIIKTSKGYITYNDPRRFGLFTYCKTDDLDKFHLFCNIGIEPFDEKFSAEYLYSKIRKKASPIKIVIMDQSIVVGIGNIYASEALFGAKISPFRPANKVTLAECEKLVYNVQSVLKKAIAAGGSTLRDYEKPDGGLGYFQNQHCVYQKTGQRCPDCTCDLEKTKGIQKATMGGRSTFYCPHKQK